MLSQAAKKSLRLAVVLSLWLLASAAGVVRMFRYAAEPGAAASTSVRLPFNDNIFRPINGGVRLVVTLHPQCTCSVATLDQLSGLIAASQIPVHTTVLMIRPEGMADGWEGGQLLEMAKNIPNAQVVIDVGGKLAGELGAKTSGQVYALDAGGQVRFSGGITPARGHGGDCAGADALAAILAGASPIKSQTAVFGCTLGDR